MDIAHRPRARRGAPLAFVAGIAVAFSTIAVGAEATSPTASSVTPVDPVRILDTRTGLGAPAARLGAGQTITLTVAGVGPIPADATGVVLNITATAATAASYVSAWPTGAAQPEASILNFTAGEDIANMITATLGEGGAINLFNSTGEVHLLADVAGYLTAGGGEPGPAGPQGPVGPAGPGATFLSMSATSGSPWVQTVDGLEIRMTCTMNSGATLGFAAPPNGLLDASYEVASSGGPAFDGVGVGTTPSGGAASVPTLLANNVHLSAVVHVRPDGPDLQVDLYADHGNPCRGYGSVVRLAPPS